MLKFALYLFFICFLQGNLALGQSPKTDTIPSLPPKSEAALENEANDSTSWLNDTTFQTKKHSAKKATIYSAIIPGLGQIYNRQYYKPPIILGLGVLFAYLIHDNHVNYSQTSSDLGLRELNKTNQYYGKPEFDPSYYDQYDVNNPQRDPNVQAYDDIGLRNLRDGYRRDRDFYVILAALTYTLNIVDAAVFAHLREFEVNDKLTMKLDPDLKFVKGTTVPTAGLTLTLNFVQK